MGEGEGGKIWENGIETCIILYMKQVASPGSMHDTGCLGLVHWDDLEGWYREGGGFRMENTCIPVADSCLYMAKPIQYCKFKKEKKKENNCMSSRDHMSFYLREIYVISSKNGRGCCVLTNSQFFVLLL